MFGLGKFPFLTGTAVSVFAQTAAENATNFPHYHGTLADCRLRCAAYLLDSRRLPCQSRASDRRPPTTYGEFRVKAAKADDALQRTLKVESSGSDKGRRSARCDVMIGKG